MDDRRTEAATDTSPARRGELLASITDLFGSAGGAVSPTTAGLFSEIILGVFDDMQAGEQAILVERIADLPNAPADVLRFLALRETEFAEPVLRRSVAFEEADLALFAASLPHDRLCAIAARSHVPEAVSDALLDRGDRAVLRLLAQNPGARFSQHGLAILVDEAAHKLAQRHAGRTSDEARGQVLEFSGAPRAPRFRRAYAVAEAPGIVIAFRGQACQMPEGEADAAPGPALSAVAEVIATVASGDRMMEVAGLLAEFAGLPVDVVRRMIAKPDTMPLAVLCKAAGVSDEAFAAITAIRGRRHGHSAEAMETLVRAYQALGPEDAAKALRFLRSRQEAPEATAGQEVPAAQALDGGMTMPVQNHPAL